MIFETHAHYDDEKFDSDRVELLSSMKKKGIGTIINVGASLVGAKQSVALAKQYDFIYAAVGVHPSEISDLETATPEEFPPPPGYDPADANTSFDRYGLEWLYATAKAEKKVVSIGEIGLDYYWEKDPDVQQRQQARFREQLAIARELDLPVIVHSRDAAEDTLSIMKDAAKAGTRAVIHCFSYSPEMAAEYVKLGYYIGVGGVVTFKNGKKLKETVRQIPLERVLTETDSPYLAPEPFRGMRNDSTYLPYVVKTIAELKEITDDEVIEVTSKNAYDFFSISG